LAGHILGYHYASNGLVKERRESEWRELMEAAGLQVLKIWRSSNSAESLIECELAKT
jgi:hypothetical protein